MAAGGYNGTKQHGGSHEVRDGAAKAVLDVTHYFFMEYFAIILSCL